MQSQQIEFGHKLKDLFPIDPKFISVNNASYGMCPKEVLDAKTKYENEANWNNELWFRYTKKEKMVETRKMLAEDVNADFNDIVLVNNATDAMNCCFASINFEKGDKIITTDIQYENVACQLQHLIDKFQIEIIYVPLTIEMMNDDELFIHNFEAALQKEGKIKAAVIYHQSATPAIIFPIKELTSLCRKQGIIVIIDGAHVIGQFDLNISSIGCDFYMSNIHKWGFSPRPSAMLWIRKEFQETAVPAVIGQYKKGFQYDFLQRGTFDYSNQIAIYDSILFRRRLGDKKIKQYIHNLAWDAAVLIKDIWGTDILIKNKEKHAALINIKIPFLDAQNPNHDVILAQAIEKTLKKYNTFVNGFKLRNEGFYARFGAYIYNELSDFEYAAKHFLSVLKDELQIQ